MPFDDNWLRQDGLLGGRIQFDSLVSESKYSSVYRMRDTRDSHVHLLRVWMGPSDPQEQAEFQQTFIPLWSKLSQLDHPRLPHITDAFSLEGRTYILRDEVAGRSLLSYIESAEPLDESLVRDWGGQLCDIVHYLHSKGVYLGVVRPNDVFIQPDGTVRLADYGPLMFWPAPRRRTITKDWLGGMVPPEVAKGHEIRASSDIYTIGALLHYTLTRIKPRTAASPFTMLGKYREDVSRDFNRVIMRCLSFSPDGRFDDAHALKVALLGQAGPMGSAQAEVAAPMQSAMYSATPPQLLFLDVVGKSPAVQKLSIGTSGPDDKVQLLPNHPWLTVSPDVVKGERGDVLVSVDPRQLSPDGPLHSEILVSGSGGTMKVPVQASLRPSGLAKTGGGVATALVLLVPSILLFATAGIHGYMLTQIQTLLSTHSKHMTDVSNAQMLADMFAVWMLLALMFMPLLSLLVFQQSNLETRQIIYIPFVLSLFEPLLNLWLASDSGTIKNEAIVSLMNGHVYTPAFLGGCIASILVYSEAGWLPRLSADLQRYLGLATRLALGLSFVIAMVQVFR